MNGKAPITLCLYIAAAGHYSSRTLYRCTLDHLDRQLPLGMLTKVAHIKARPSEVAAAEHIAADLRARGFARVEVAVADWERGASHYIQCALDQRKVSQWDEVNDNRFVWHLDDDGLVCSHSDPLERLLARMTEWIDESPNNLTFRFLRREDRNSLIEVGPEPAHGDWFYSQHLNWQLPLMRSSHYYLLHKVIEDNWATAIQMHGEALWREVLAPFSRSPRKHAVWVPERVETIHIGVPDYVAVCAQHGLLVSPNPTFP